MFCSPLSIMQKNEDVLQNQNLPCFKRDFYDYGNPQDFTDYSMTDSKVSMPDLNNSEEQD